VASPDMVQVNFLVCILEIEITAYIKITFDKPADVRWHFSLHKARKVIENKIAIWQMPWHK